MHGTMSSVDNASVGTHWTARLHVISWPNALTDLVPSLLRSALFEAVFDAAYPNVLHLVALEARYALAFAPRLAPWLSLEGG